MKKYLPLLILICFALPVSLTAQIWPLGIPNLPTGCSPSMNMVRCTKTAINNGDWKNPATWSPNGVPDSNAIVCIPAGITVEINNPTYNPVPSTSPCTGSIYTNNSSTPRLAIFICGTLDFKAGGKLNLGCGSVLSILPSSGRIIPARGNSDVIQIGEKEVWGRDNDTVKAPSQINYGGGPFTGVLTASFKSIEAKLQTPYEAFITWITASEVNSKEFILEKSKDAINWIAVQKIAAKGNSNTETFYTLSDKNLTGGTTYYRIKQLGEEGKAEFSDVTSVTNNLRGRIAVYPNPAVSNASLYCSDLIARNQSVQLYNMNGAFIQTLSSNGSNVLHFGTSHLSPGLYLIRIVENGKTIAETKLIKQ
jgi:hypothetical protein